MAVILLLAGVVVVTGASEEAGPSNEAVTFMTTRTGLTDPTAQAEVTRYCAWPTQHGASDNRCAYQTSGVAGCVRSTAGTRPCLAVSVRPSLVSSGLTSGWRGHASEKRQHYPSYLLC